MNFVLLLFEEHPVGRQILNECIKNGFFPNYIIQEKSSFGLKKRALYETVLTRTIPTIQALSKEHNIRTFRVGNHNHDECYDRLIKEPMDLILLGNTRIIKKHIFKIPKEGCINTHPGLLPEVRGAFPVVWSIYHKKPVGCTSHFIDDGVDTGQIIAKQEIPINPHDTLDSLIEKTVYVSAHLSVNALKDYGKGTLKAMPQSLAIGETFTWPDDDVIEQAKKILRLNVTS